MIEFDDMDDRLKNIGKNRQWLADESGRAPDSIRTALAPGAPAAKRSPKLQRVLSEVIERAEKDDIRSALPERIILEVSSQQLDHFAAAAKAAGLTLKEWIIAELGNAARQAKYQLSAVADDTAPYGTDAATGTDAK